MPKLTVAKVREHIETDLSDSAVQRLIDDAYSAIERKFGIDPVAPATTVTELLSGTEGSLFPSRPVGTVTSINETVGDTTTVLAADDYLLRYGGRVIERLSGGTNQRTRWGSLVEIVFTPADAMRDRVVVDLVKLAIRYEGGVTSETVGDHSETRSPLVRYQSEREQILQALAPSAFGFA